LILWARAFAVNIGGDEDMVQFAQKPPHSLSFRSAALSREKCAARAAGGKQIPRR
jgi:hypothetical protein